MGGAAMEELALRPPQCQRERRAFNRCRRRRERSPRAVAAAAAAERLEAAEVDEKGVLQAPRAPAPVLSMEVVTAALAAEA